MALLKVTKNQGFTLSSEDTFFEKPQEGLEGFGGGGSSMKISEALRSIAMFVSAKPSIF